MNISIKCLKPHETVVDGKHVINGTSYKSSIHLTYAQLVEFFGQPTYQDIDDKVCFEWVLKINDKWQASSWDLSAGIMDHWGPLLHNSSSHIGKGVLPRSSVQVLTPSSEESASVRNRPTFALSDSVRWLPTITPIFTRALRRRGYR